MDLQHVFVRRAPAVGVGGISEVSLPFVTLQRAQVEKADKQWDGRFHLETVDSAAEDTH